MLRSSSELTQSTQELQEVWRSLISSEKPMETIKNGFVDIL